MKNTAEEQLATLVNGLGLSPEQLAGLMSGGGGGKEDPLGFSIFGGRKKVRTTSRSRRDSRTGWGGTSTSATRFKTTEEDVDSVLTARDVFNGFLNTSKTSPAQVRALQQKLYRAGYYGSMKPEEFGKRLGNRNDPFTKAALSDALSDTGDAYAAGEKLTLDGLLDSSPAMGGDDADGEKKPVFAYQPPDPAALKQAIDKSMPGFIGQALSPAETEMLTAEIQRNLEASARSAFSVREKGGVAAPEFDAEAYVERRAQELRPDDFGAKRMADLSEQFLAGIRSGPVDRTF